MPTFLSALTALILIAPAPSVGVMVGLRLKQSRLGVVLWAVAKIWLFGLPLLWHLVVDGGTLSFSPVEKGGWGLGIATGLAMGFGILLGYVLARRLNWIDPERLRTAMAPVGLLNRGVYLGAALYWIGVNSVLEEYVYRWFVFSQAEVLCGRSNKRRPQINTAILDPTGAMAVRRRSGSIQFVGPRTYPSRMPNPMAKPVAIPSTSTLFDRRETQRAPIHHKMPEQWKSEQPYFCYSPQDHTQATLLETQPRPSHPRSVQAR